MWVFLINNSVLNDLLEPTHYLAYQSSFFHIQGPNPVPKESRKMGRKQKDGEKELCFNYKRHLVAAGDEICLQQEERGKLLKRQPRHSWSCINIALFDSEAGRLSVVKYYY